MAAVVPGDKDHLARTLSSSQRSSSPTPRTSIHSAFNTAAAAPGGTGADRKMSDPANAAIVEEPKQPEKEDEVAPKYEGPSDAAAAPTDDKKPLAVDTAASTAGASTSNGAAPEVHATDHAAGPSSAAAVAKPEPAAADPTREPSVIVASPTAATGSVAIATPPKSPTAATGTGSISGGKIDPKAVKAAMKSQEKYEKVLAGEEKTDAKRLSSALKQAGKASKAQAQAAKMEAKAKSKLDSATKRAYKLEKAFLKAKAAHEKAEADRAAAKNTFELKTAHHTKLKEERQATLDAADSVRKEKAENDADRAHRRTASVDATRASMVAA